MSATLVAIIVGCYKQEEYVKQAIYSAQNQIRPFYAAAQEPYTYLPSFQVVTVHDNCKGVGSGIAEARNRAIAEVSAAWIIWLDADDLLPSNYIFEMWQNAAAHTPLTGTKPLIASPVQFISGCRMDVFHTLDLWRSPSASATSSAGAKKLCLSYPMAMACMFSKELWNQVGGFDTKLSRNVDLDFWIRCREAGAALHLASNTHLLRRNVKPYELTFSAKEEFIEKDKQSQALRMFAKKHNIALRDSYLPYLIPSTKIL